MAESKIKEQYKEKTWKFLKNIRQEFWETTGRKVEECRLVMESDWIHCYWQEDSEATPWFSFAIKEIPNNEVYSFLYQTFKKKLGFRDFPWGALQGVRPTKLVHQRIKQGFSTEDHLQYLKCKYGVEPNRAQLLVEIAERQNELMSEIPDSVGIYIGIPFCPSRCFYCSFPGEILPNDQRGVHYFWDFLKEDIQRAAVWVRTHKIPISSVYIGGGTPTTLPNSLLEELMRLLHEEFDLSVLQEFSLEAGRPETLTATKLMIARQAGVDRISINPQTMNEKTLQRIGRNHSVREIYDCFEIARKVGFDRINMDLIAGLPNESVSDFIDSVKQLLRFSPENITIHSLAFKKGSEWVKQMNFSLPEKEEMKQMLDIGRQLVTANGYSPYYLYRQKNSPGHFENIGYAKKGFESIYNIQMMEETHTIIGCGPGSATKKRDNRGRIYNYYFPKERKRYEAQLESYLQLRENVLERGSTESKEEER